MELAPGPWNWSAPTQTLHGNGVKSPSDSQGLGCARQLFRSKEGDKQVRKISRRWCASFVGGGPGAVVEGLKCVGHTPCQTRIVSYGAAKANSETDAALFEAGRECDSRKLLGFRPRHSLGWTILHPGYEFGVCGEGLHSAK